MRTKQTTAIETTTILWNGLLTGLIVLIVSLLVMSPKPLEAKSKKTTVASVATLPTQGTVTKVYDGDTITIASGGQTFACRLLGIDTPELSYGKLWSEMEKVRKYAPADGHRQLTVAEKVFREWAKQAEGHAKEARVMLQKKLLHQEVQLQYDQTSPTKDQYGRLLVYVSLRGQDINAFILTNGLAVAETRFSCDRLEAYVKLWRAAQKQRVGMWTAITVPEASLITK